jgi:hypothetical protein
MAKAFKAARIGVGSDDWSVWIADNNNRLWSLVRKGSSYQWINDEDGGVVELAVDGNGNVWAVNPKGIVYMRVASRSTPDKGDWIRRTPNVNRQPVKVKRIAAGQTGVMAVDDGKKLWRLSGNRWVRSSHKYLAKDIAVGAGKTAFVVGTTSRYYKRTGNTWGTSLGTISGLTTWAAGFDSSLCYLGPQGIVYHLKNGSFQPDPIGKGHALAVRNTGDIWLINPAGQIWRRTTRSFKNTLVKEVMPIKDSANKTIGYWTRIAPPDFSKAKIYWAEPRDTFAKMSRELNINYNALLRANPQVRNKDRVSIGERIKLP